MSIISISKDIDKFIIHIGNMLSWLALLLVLVVCTSVFLRYILGISSLGFDELQWHLYSFGFMMGFSYCTASDTHIRNDLLYNNFSDLTKHLIDLLSHFCFSNPLPFVDFCIASICKLRGLYRPRWTAIPMDYQVCFIISVCLVWNCCNHSLYQHNCQNYPY